MMTLHRSLWYHCHYYPAQVGCSRESSRVACAKEKMELYVVCLCSQIGKWHIFIGTRLMVCVHVSVVWVEAFSFNLKSVIACVHLIGDI